MTRDEFEASFLNYELPQVRHAHLMKALAVGPDGPLNGLHASFYNEVYFLACYALFQRHPTLKAAILMGFHCMPRSGAEPGNPGPPGMCPWELLVDPRHHNSYAHGQVKAKCNIVSVEYNSKHNPNGMLQHERQLNDKFVKYNTLMGMFRPMVSQLWNMGGPMREYLATIGGWSHDELIDQAEQNYNMAMDDPVKAKWLNDRIGRAMGSTTLSERFGVTFDSVQVGLESVAQRYARMGVQVGGHRG
jgi:hypothetical protein